MALSTPTRDQQLDQYAALILDVGLKLQAGQKLVIEGGAMPLDEVTPFLRRLIRIAYERGARDVEVNTSDSEIARLRFTHAAEEALQQVGDWRVQRLTELGNEHASFFYPTVADPDLLAAVPPERIALASRAAMRAFKPFSDERMQMRHVWCIAGIPTKPWARKVFPHLDEAAALDALWDYVLHTMRVDTPDPVAALSGHLSMLGERANAITSRRFAQLHYTAPGTDLTINLPTRHKWISVGNNVSPAGATFAPNLPSEEVFSMPQRDGVNGTVRSTLPLIYQGQRIEGITLRFEQGRIVDYGAQVGADVLKTIVETDEGSHYLGEVALVSADAPTNAGIPIFNTLYDENAACHLAIGAAIPPTLEGSDQMSPEELAANGANVSMTHVDFMVGSTELHIDGITASGERVAVLHNGLWVLP